MEFKLNDPKNNLKNVLHAFFLALAVTIAEPSTVMPLMLSYFTANTAIIGLYSSLLRGGAIVVQLYAAFHAQTYKRVLPALKLVFFARFLSWFLIGFSIILFGKEHKTLTLFLIGLGLFFFSLPAGFGAIYFKELQAKLFSKKYRGKTISNRNIAGAIATIISGGVAGWVISSFEAPLNFGYLFLVSSFLMAIGFIAFSTINEPPKQNVAKKEKNFKDFIKNAAKILKNDKIFKVQILAILLSYGYFFALPFVILHAKETITLTGWLIGGFISVQMVGSLIGNLILWRNISNYELMLILSYIILIAAFLVTLFSNSAFAYALFFFLFGIAFDGISNSSMNLVIEIAPEDKRPAYTAIQTNIASLGLFFPIIGGSILKVTNSYDLVYYISIFTLIAGLIVSIWLNKIKTKLNY
jgi:MFS family permease